MMSEQNQLPAFLDGYSVGEAIADHNGVVCYPALKDDSDDKYIVKKISVPQSAVQLAALLLTGAYSSREDALTYFHDLAQEVLREVHTLNSLSTLEGFLPYLASTLQPKEDENGFEILLLSPYRLSLEQIFSDRMLTHREILDLAMDLCAGLAAARRAGFLYVDLKPGNIFFTPQQDYRIGDLGFVQLSSLQYASLPDKYLSEYTAPEISGSISQLNSTLDVYALGMVLYQAYNGGTLPQERPDTDHPLVPPLYADYELAQIILTACHPDPAARWQDPTAMGQALVQYMQQFGVPEGDLVPPPVATPELDAGEDFLPEVEATDDDFAGIPELQYIQELEEAAKQEQENSHMTDDALVSEEISGILAQADDLIAHELPDPVIPPEPVEIPIPEPIPLEEAPALPEEPEDAEILPPPQETAPSAEAEPEEPKAEPTPSDSEEALPNDANQEAPQPKIPLLRWILSGLIVILAGVLVFLGIRQYQNNYLQTVDSIELSASADSITVVVVTDIDETLLQLTCSDAYGNSKTATLTDGTATFTGLHPNTVYTVRLSISGPHQLLGPTAETITTRAQTQVSHLTASMGPVDGSVYLSFRVTGVECDDWLLTYSAENSDTKTISFVGHAVTVYDLQIGQSYTFTLSATDAQSLIGETTVSFTACKIQRAENAVITHCGNGTLTVQWDPPESDSVEYWTVRCHDSSGYDQTVTTTDCSYTFQGLTHETACTVEITAADMPQGVFASVCANPINIEGFTMTPDNAGMLLLIWQYTGAVPQGGWRISWSCDGTKPQLLETAENSVLLPYIPGGQYTLSLIPADDTEIFGHTQIITAPEAEAFSGFGVTAAQLQLSMCVTPGNAAWKWNEISETDYKTSFSNGETAGFVIWCDGEPEALEETVVFTFILQDSQGALVSFTAAEAVWSQLWDQNFCALSIPQMPAAPGEYTLLICLNGQFLHRQSFQIN